MNRLRNFCPFLCLALLLGCPRARQQASAPAPPAASALLPAPAQISPAIEAIIRTFPRTITYQWSAVPGAAGYKIEVDCFHCCETNRWCSDVRPAGYVISHTYDPAFTHEFAGNQPGRWRVWGVDAKGREGTKSDWCDFRCDTEVTAATRPATSGAPQGGLRDPVTGRAYSSGDGVTLPRAVYAPNPPYTRRAIEQKVQGAVLLDVLVGPDGLVKETHVKRSLAPDLDASAVQTVKTWRFSPAQRNGQPVPVLVTVEVTFYLK